jgi:hypothetical protein
LTFGALVVTLLASLCFDMLAADIVSNSSKVLK